MEPSRRPRPEKDKQALNCPRCKSTNTKFCYYNNYSLTQPRYFCKTCRRYWTAGGSLRNVPVGGCTRKNKRSSPSSSSPSPSKNQLPHDHDQLPHHPHELTTPNGFPQPTSQNPKTITHDQGQDLNLAYPPPSTTCNDKYTPFSSFYSSGYPIQEFKPCLNSVSVDGYYGNLQGVIPESGSSSGGAARLFFPVEDLKLQPSIISSNYRDGFVDQQNIIRGGGEGSGYWSGMLGGGGTWLA